MRVTITVPHIHLAMGMQFLEGKTMTKRCVPGNLEDFDLEVISFTQENAIFDMDLGKFSNAILASCQNSDVDYGFFQPQDAKRPRRYGRGTTAALGKLESSTLNSVEKERVNSS